MKAISIRQPWASFILLCGKDIENREWSTRVRGRVLLHAGKGMTHDEHEDGIFFGIGAIRKASATKGGPSRVVTLRELGFSFEDLPRGGIVGSVEIVDCVSVSASPWFVGKYGFVLRDPKPLPFIPFKGALGFFDVPDSLVSVKETP